MCYFFGLDGLDVQVEAWKGYDRIDGFQTRKTAPCSDGGEVRGMPSPMPGFRSDRCIQMWYKTHSWI